MVRKSMIVAHDQERTIGNEGDMPWYGELPADLRHFKEVTSGHAIIMGRKTYDSIGKPLPNRQNIVVTRQEDLKIEGCEVVNSIDEAYKAGADEDELFIIGGSSIYRLVMDDVDSLYITEIHDVFEGDAHFPELLDEEWAEVERIDHKADEKNKYDYSFVKYERKK